MNYIIALSLALTPLPVVSGCHSCNKQLSYQFKPPLFIAFRSISLSGLTLLHQESLQERLLYESKHRKTLGLREKLEVD